MRRREEDDSGRGCPGGIRGRGAPGVAEKVWGGSGEGKVSQPTSLSDFYRFIPPRALPCAGDAGKSGALFCFGRSSAEVVVSKHAK